MNITDVVIQVKDRSLYKPHFGPGLVLGMAALVALSGCRSPVKWRDSADSVAHAALGRAQQDGLGRVEPLDIEPPSDSFRRRLIETQALPVVAVLSADPARLPALPHWNPAWRPLSEAEPPPVSNRLVSGAEPVLTLTDALQLAARGNRDYQSRKEALFLTALALDLEEEAFRNTLAGMLSGRTETAQDRDETVSAIGAESSLSATRMLRTGARVAAALTVDLVNLLTQDRASAFGVRLDSSISIPLGRGAGRHVVMEPLTQAARDLLAAVWDFEHYKADFAVDVAARYFDVLASEDQVRNAAESYRRLAANARRAQRMSEAGRLPEIQVDQAVQEELRASSRSVAAVRRYADALDQFKVFLGLPPDARLRLDRGELEALLDKVGVEAAWAGPESRRGDGNDARVTAGGPPENAGRWILPSTGEPELTEADALSVALADRLDLRAELARVEDAQRKVIVAADALGMELTLSADAAFGERRSLSAADQGDARLRFDEGRYSALVRLDAPWKRTAERNAMRRSLINLEQAVRKLQEKEDRVKLQVRGDLRGLEQASETLKIQAEAMRIAVRQVRGSDLFLEAGRAAIRDVLEAQEALLSAQNAFTDAVVEHRLSELGFRRNLGRLRIDADGLWTEWSGMENSQPPSSM